MSTPKRLALVGVGGHGSHHLHCIRHLESQGRVKLTSVADPFADRLPAEKARLDEAGVAWHATHQELFASNPDLDGVIISTPIHLHATMLEDALRMTSASILLEKPAFPTVTQLERFASEEDNARVRIAFQMIHWPDVQAIKTLLCSGQTGAIRSISISAGLPRLASYYQRAGWAGRLLLNGTSVFDGPATNAAAHLLHIAMFFAGSEPNLFATPTQVSGEFYRSRAIESYDFAWLQAEVGGIAFHTALAHCVKDHTPYRICVETEKGTFTLQESPPYLMTPSAFEITPVGAPAPTKLPMYTAWLDGASLPTTLVDTRGYSLLTCGGLMASGGIREIPAHEIARDQDNNDVSGLTEYLRRFVEEPGSPTDYGFSWADRGARVDLKAIAEFDINHYIG